MTTQEILKEAKSAAPVLMSADTETKNAALEGMAAALEENTQAILEANALDMEAAKGTISPVMLDRLALNPQRIAGMAQGIRQVAQLPDPAWKVLETITRPSGIKVEKTAVPLGVVGIIYESRPNVTADAAALCVKSGNACVLRSGKEAWRSANAIVTALRQGVEKACLPATCVNLIQDTSRASSQEMMVAKGLIDLLIPRGGAGLIRACVENATVPCIETGTGICHIYLDETADPEMAVKIVVNAKTSRPSVCNAEEVLLVNRKAAPTLLPLLHKALVEDRAAAGEIPVELRLDKEAAAIIPGTPAGEKDFDTEFLDYILAVGVVENVEEAIAHINAHSSGHSEAIVTANEENAQKFTRMVDSAAVYVNASTRFTDGGEFGLGCEMGISTQKLHARGPMGLGELCTYKYIVKGTGQIR